MCAPSRHRFASCGSCLTPQAVRPNPLALRSTWRRRRCRKATCNTRGSCTSSSQRGAVAAATELCFLARNDLARARVPRKLVVSLERSVLLDHLGARHAARGIRAPLRHAAVARARPIVARHRLLRQRLTCRRVDPFGARLTAIGLLLRNAACRKFGSSTATRVAAASTLRV